MPHIDPSPLLPLSGLRELSRDLALRVRVRWSAPRLDAMLARGIDPVSSDELTLRAEQLSSAEKRAELARSIRGLLRLSDGRYGAQLPMTRAPVATQRVAANRRPLLHLRARILGEGPHSPRGLALVSRLLEDQQSPLYSHELSENRLEPAIRDALFALGAVPGNGVNEQASLVR